MERPVIVNEQDQWLRQFALVDVATGGEVDLGEATHAELSGDRMHVHLARLDDQCVPSIETLDLTGTVVEHIEGTFRSGDLGFTWSADGTEVAFRRLEVWEPDWCHFHRDHGELFFPGGSPLRVSSAEDAWVTSRSLGQQGSAVYSGPHWAPDGSLLAFSGDDSPTFWLTDPRSGDVIDLEATLPESDSVVIPDNLAWSPDSRLLALTFQSSDVEQVVGILDIKDRSMATTEACAMWMLPAWAPVGEILAAYCSKRVGSGWMLIDASGATRFMGEASEVLREVDWAPDGEWLVFGVRGVGGPLVYLMPIDGSRDAAQLTTGFPLGWAAARA